MGLLSNSNAIESGGYSIDRSLRFRSSASANLTRTFGSGNQTTSTLSSWIKRGKLGAQQNIMGVSGGGSNDAELFFDGGDTLTFTSWNGGSRPLGNITTAAVFRDPSAWYHIVLVVDTSNATSTERLRLYVNGARQTVTGAYPAQNATWYWNGANAHTIGVYANPTNQIYLDGYLAEVNFIDGQALIPSSFGQTDAVTGVWQPKKYTGTYGTNGFYLDFKTNTSPTTLAQDKSGNGNNWTPNNISTTAGATYDSMTDVPTLTSATAANYCVLNPIWKSSTASTSNANLNLSQTAALDVNQTTMGVSSGKWYWEATINSVGATPTPMIGVVKGGGLDAYTSANAYYYYGNSGQKFISGSASAYGATYTTNDVVGVALDMDAGTLIFYKNNTSQGTATTGLAGEFFPAFSNGGGPTPSWSAALNFGQRPFSFTPPTGFKALNTFNLPDPVIKKPNQYMDATTWTGNGSTQSIVNAGGFQPDLVWVKIRSNVGGHVLQDNVRGVGKTLGSQGTFAEVGNSGDLIGSFNSNGFQVNNTFLGGNDGSTNGIGTFVGWQWKKGATPGFDIVTYTGTETNRTVNHSLGVAPKMLICKVRDYAPEGWFVWHSALSGTEFLQLNTTDAKGTATNLWNSTIPTSSSFSLGTSASANRNGKNFVAYLFAEIPGFSKFGSYTGNGSADGPFVYCGFRPKYVMVKRTDAANFWLVLDTVRNTYNVMGDGLQPNSSVAEFAWNPSKDIISNGFKVRTSDAAENANGGTYIFAAFAETPFKTALAR